MWTDAQLAELMLQNREGAFGTLAELSPVLARVQTPEISRHSSAIAFPLANLVVRTDVCSERADAVITEVLESYRSRQVPCLWLVGPNSQPADLSDRLMAFGGQRLTDSPGMVLDLLAGSPAQALPVGVAVREVEGREAISEWATTVCEAFEMPAEVGEIFRFDAASPQLGPGGAVRLFTAYLDGQPVATSLLYLENGVAGLYCVGTKAEARRRGIGAAVTTAPLLAAKALGCRFATLESSEDGLHVYRRLGFREVCSLRRYLFPVLA